MSRAVFRSSSNSGRFATAAARRAMKLGPLRARAFCRPALASASWAFCLKADEVAICMAAPIGFPPEIALVPADGHGLGARDVLRYASRQFVFRGNKPMARTHRIAVLP